jgi:agmatine/peptidylarginine deiminase
MVMVAPILCKASRWMLGVKKRDMWAERAKARQTAAKIAVHDFDAVKNWARENGIKVQINPETGRDSLLMDENQRFHFKMMFDV